MEKYLYGLDNDTTADYFRWKYEENPYSNIPLGIVAIYNGIIIGFRGYYVNKWYVGNENNTMLLLSSADVCVHPDHRKKGLFKTMTEMSLKEYEHSDYAGYINLTSNQYSTPCDFKLGWLNVAARNTLRKCSLTSIAKYFLIQKLNLEMDPFRLKMGKYGKIEITDIPNINEMVSVITQQNINKTKIRLCKDSAFLHWKYRNNLKKYIFCYFWVGNSLVGFVVLGISRFSPKNTNKANIIDYAQSQKGAINKIISHIIRDRQSNIFDVWDYGLDDSLLSDFKKNRFSARKITLLLQKYSRGERYMLVRPIKYNCDENDWFIHGIDMRNPKYWEIQEVCTDSI